MTRQSDLCRAALALLALAGNAAPAQTYAPPPAPTAISPETAALAGCMTTRNPDAFRARRLANSQSSRYPNGRLIIAGIGISSLGCAKSLGPSFANADYLQAYKAAADTLKRDGDTAAPVPIRKMTAYGACLVTKSPATARRFVTAAEAAASSNLDKSTDRVTLGINDETVLQAVLSEKNCVEVLRDIADPIEVNELYAEVLRQLPAPPETPFAARPIVETGRRIELESANPELRPLAACLWQHRQDRALTITDGYIAAGGGDFPLKLRRSDFESCGGETSVQLAVANAGILAAVLYAIRINQLARCVIARDRTGLAVVLASLEAEGAKLFGYEKPAIRRNLALMTMPFAGQMRETMESCDISGSDAVNGKSGERQWLLFEFDFELRQPEGGATIVR